ncbi:MAG: DUF1822 family protein [Leptolyngbyaceae cyanobacterium bins.302]|nr:DUF1822 family protein [Leptolyngbyaceae cyanobacterium bins.302]
MCPASTLPFTIPLSLDAHHQADRLRRQQTNARKGKQVYLNTLAVYAVHQYLELLGIATDLTTSDSQDHVLVSLLDTADLMIAGVGKLECCVVLPEAKTMTLVSPTNRDRIGCIAVALDAELRQATLLGFVKHWATETLSVDDLQPLAALPEYLETLKQRVNLQLWFQNVTTTTWQTIEQIMDEMTGMLGQPSPTLAYHRSTTSTLPNTIPALIDLFHSNRDRWTGLQVLGLLGSIAQEDASAIAFLSQIIQTTEDDELRRQAAVSLGLIQPNHDRAGVRRARVLELGMQLEQQRLLLVITLTPNTENGTEVHLRVYPTASQALPPHLQLNVLDEFGHPFLAEQTLGQEDWIQLVFHGTPGDCFRIELALDTASFSEAFVI